MPRLAPAPQAPPPGRRATSAGLLVVYPSSNIGGCCRRSRKSSSTSTDTTGYANPRPVCLRRGAHPILRPYDTRSTAAPALWVGAWPDARGGSLEVITCNIRRGYGGAIAVQALVLSYVCSAS